MLELKELSRANLESCVHCGFCLEVCPTYGELGIEDDSPRGRIHLIRSLAAGTLEPVPKVLEHLDLCLDCRACESSCPSGVKYGVIIEDARAQLEAGRKRSFWDVRVRRFFMQGVFPRPARLRSLARGLRMVQKLKLDRAAVKLGLVRGRTAAMAAAARVPDRFGSDVLPDFVPARGARRATVAFVQGCVSDVMFGPTNIATVRVLAANGCDVKIPAAQTCCGGLAYPLRRPGAGPPAGAPEHRCVPGDGRGLHHHQRRGMRLDAQGVSLACWRRTRPTPAKPSSSRPRCGTSPSIWRPSSRWRRRNPLPLKVAYQDACHLAHGQGIRLQPRKVLSLIPGIELVSLPQSETCCGSAGIYNIVQPEMADALLRKKMSNIAASGAQVVAVANAGCMMQLRLGVRQYGPEVEVVHIVDLLDRAYGAEPAGGRN